MEEAQDGPKKRAVPAVTRAVAILRALGKSDEPMGVQQLARELGLVPSTVLHILRVLHDEGLVAFDSQSKRYSIDVGILAIARSAIQKNAFVSLIQPRLDALAVEFGVTTIATQFTDPTHMVVVALSQVQLAFRLQVDLGSRFPAMISATGRCFAAYNRPDEAEMKARFERLNWDHAPDYARWLAEVAETRARGYSVDRGDYISGVTVVAVPFFDAAGRMDHSMVAIGITERVDAIGQTVLAKAMLKVRDGASQMLLGAGAAPGAA
ncbi:IclR family transcriptional regulator [Pseudoruegeria sp. HB172150]|uniref:IclR family transcriptional regulator n=1 Tax=Pseudoruegeria sp. HB172150 TaxID=2721164 RepID=UPI001557894B|nr:IclR family transcriptional regulator [Pseudoruegeria sp. HB172150]